MVFFLSADTVPFTLLILNILRVGGLELQCISFYQNDVLLQLTKRINENSDPTKDTGTQVENRDIIIPPLPFDLEAVERLLQETSARALASK